ncbi:MAG: hypothetical protein BGO99_00540 [Nitrosospira sp. 56-18]|nr:MAG: hypothetical protein BGO99_00540 [Nitrosospira sp. 56-18]
MICDSSNNTSADRSGGMGHPCAVPAPFLSHPYPILCHPRHCGRYATKIQIDFRVFGISRL